MAGAPETLGRLDTPKNLTERPDGALAELNQALECWNSRLAAGDARLVERYIEGEIAVHVHVRVVKPKPDRLCAVYERAKHVLPEVGESINPVRVYAWASADLQSLTDNASPDNNERIVLVEVVQLADQIERMAGEVVPSCMRLERIDQEHGVCASATDHTTAFRFVAFSVSKYRELMFDDGHTSTCEFDFASE